MTDTPTTEPTETTETTPPANSDDASKESAEQPKEFIYMFVVAMTTDGEIGTINDISIPDVIVRRTATLNDIAIASHAMEAEARGLVSARTTTAMLNAEAEKRIKAMQKRQMEAQRQASPLIVPSFQGPRG